jgi:hypothetical protein
MAERKDLRAFVKKHCAITAPTDGTDTVAEPGYFRFDAGRTSKESRKAGAKVDWGADPEATADQVQQRVDMLVADGHARIYVRAIGHADSYPLDSLMVEGDPEAALDIPADPKGQHAVNEAVAAVMLGQQRQVDRLCERVERLGEERQEAMLQAGLYMLAAQGAQDGGRMAAVKESLTALGPTLERTIPLLVSAWLGTPLPAPPVEPGAEPGVVLDAAIGEMDGLFARMASIAVAHPGSMTPERLARITGILAKYGGSKPTGDSGQPVTGSKPVPTSDSDPPVTG